MNTNEIEKLKNLKESGVLTEEEFEIEKNKILNAKNIKGKKIGDLKFWIFTGVIIGISICIIIFFGTKRNQGVNNAINTGKNLEVEMFNDEFEVFQDGTYMEFLIEKIVANNIASSDRQVSLTYEGKNYSDSSEISKIKSKILNTKKFNVSFEYDKNGYINKVIITDTNSSSVSKIEIGTKYYTTESGNTSYITFISENNFNMETSDTLLGMEREYKGNYAIQGNEITLTIVYDSFMENLSKSASSTKKYESYTETIKILEDGSLKFTDENFDSHIYKK